MHSHFRRCNPKRLHTTVCNPKRYTRIEWTTLIIGNILYGQRRKHPPHTRARTHKHTHIRKKKRGFFFFFLGGDNPFKGLSIKMIKNAMELAMFNTSAAIIHSHCLCPSPGFSRVKKTETFRFFIFLSVRRSLLGTSCFLF